MDIPTPTELLAKIDGFCARHDMAETRFGRDSVNNPAFIRELRDGKSPTLKTLNSIADFMRDKDEEARLREKLTAPLAEPIDEEEVSLPFAPAPVNPTGASSPTCSSTAVPPITSPANGSSHSTAADRADVQPNLSCSAEQSSPTVGFESLSADAPGRRAKKTPGAPSLFNGDSPLAGPSTPTVAGEER